MNKITLVINEEFSLPIVNFFDRLEAYNTDYIVTLELKAEVDLNSEDFVYSDMAQLSERCLQYYNENSIQKIEIFNNDNLIYMTTAYKNFRNIEIKMEESESPLTCELFFEKTM